MSTDIKLERGVKGYNIVRKKCPNCGVEFVFKLHKNAVHDVGGDALYYPE
jgi:ribosomal protein L19